MRTGSATLALASVPLALAGVLLLGSCAVRPPGIGLIEPRLLVVATDAAGHREERLSCFVSVSDGDGTGDIDYLYLVHDESELFWTLTADTWTSSDDGAGAWLGSNGLRSGDLVMPRGSYRVLVVDKAGERDERTFRLSAPPTRDMAMPALSISGTDLRLDSGCALNTLLFLDAGGTVVMTAQVKPGTTALDALWPKQAWRTQADYIAVYGFDPKAEIGFLSWKIRLPD